MVLCLEKAMRRSLTIPSLFWVVFSLTGLPNDLNTPVLAQAAAPGGPQGPVEPEPPPEQQKQLESFIIQGQQAFDKKDWVAAEKAWKAGLARAQSFNSRQ